MPWLLCRPEYPEYQGHELTAGFTLISVVPLLGLPQHCPMDISVLTECFMDVLTNMEATNHRWLLSTSVWWAWLNFVASYWSVQALQGSCAGPCNFEELSLVLTLLFPAAYLHGRPLQPPMQPRGLSSTSNWSFLHLQTPLPWWVSSHSGNPYSENRLQVLPPAWSRGKGRDAFYITLFPLSFLPLPLNHPSILFKLIL